MQGQINLAKISDNYGRLNIWGSDTGILRGGRGSLDERLRTDQRLRCLVLDILGELREVLGDRKPSKLTLHKRSRQ